MTAAHTGIPTALSAEGEQPSPGSILVRLRTARNLSTADVAQRLKYGPRQIEALENDDFSKLPGTTFVRGMIRSYARFLGADPQAVLQEYDRHHVSDPMTVELHDSHIPFPDGAKKGTRIYAVLSALLILAAGVVVYELQSGNRLWKSLSETSSRVTVQNEAVKPLSPGPSAPTVAQMESVKLPAVVAQVESAKRRAVSEPSTSGAATAAKTGLKRISLQFERESWVQIKQGDGKILLSQLNASGTRRLVEGIPPFTLVIGNAPSVRITYNDEPLDLRPHFKVDVARLVLE